METNIGHGGWTSQLYAKAPENTNDSLTLARTCCVAILTQLWNGKVPPTHLSSIVKDFREKDERKGQDFVNATIPDLTISGLLTFPGRANKKCCFLVPIVIVFANTFWTKKCRTNCFTPSFSLCTDTSKHMDVFDPGRLIWSYDLSSGQMIWQMPQVDHVAYQAMRHDKPNTMNPPSHTTAITVSNQ